MTAVLFAQHYDNGVLRVSSSLSGILLLCDWPVHEVWG